MHKAKRKEVLCLWPLPSFSRFCKAVAPWYMGTYTNNCHHSLNLKRSKTALFLYLLWPNSIIHYISFYHLFVMASRLIYIYCHCWVKTINYRNDAYLLAQRMWEKKLQNNWKQRQTTQYNDIMNEQKLEMSYCETSYDFDLIRQHWISWNFNVKN